MSFDSYSFLFILLVITLICYFLVKFLSKNKPIAKNIVLLLASLIFYFWGGGLLFFLIVIGYLLVVYLFGFLLEKSNNKILLIVAILISLSLMIVYKILNQVSNIVLPLAVSFISFQSCAYLIDIYRKKIPAEKNPVNFFTYSLLFTKLVQGPIMTYKSINEQLNNREENWENFSSGVVRFSFGLAKKILIAGFIYTTLSKIDAQIGFVSPGVAILDVFLYSLFIYFDFSSYSDMAVGLSKMFGIKVLENFNYPYTATSITDFWRRWHISLSLWFKEYVYFPLGGSRNGKIRTLINVAIVFLLTGLWHGFNWNFLIWGAYFAIVMVIEKAFFYKVLEKNRFKPLNGVYVWIIVAFSWIFFKNSSIESSFNLLKNIFGQTENTVYITQVITIKGMVGVGLGILSLGYLQKLLIPKMEKYKQNSCCIVATFVFAILLIAVCTFFIVAGTYSPSIYGGF